MKFVSRREWGAQYAQGSGAIPGPVRGVTCHWEGPPMGYPWGHRDCFRKVRAIERFHAVSRGWSGIAYNAVVCPHGYVFEGRGTGVRSAANGTSNIGGNDQWYAVCYLGGVGDPFTADGQQGMADAIGWLRTAGDAGPAVNGHRDHHATECPGDVIYRWVQAGIDSPVTEEDDMPTPEEIAKAVWGDEMGAKGERETARHKLIRAANASLDNRRMLRNMRDLPDEVAAEVAADVEADLKAGGGIDVSELRRIVFNQASRAVSKRLGSLDEPEK